jgi:hypothetical protein
VRRLRAAQARTAERRRRLARQRAALFGVVGAGVGLLLLLQRLGPIGKRIVRAAIAAAFGGGRGRGVGGAVRIVRVVLS